MRHRLVVPLWLASLAMLLARLPAAPIERGPVRTGTWLAALAPAAAAYRGAQSASRLVPAVAGPRGAAGSDRGPPAPALSPDLQRPAVAPASWREARYPPVPPFTHSRDPNLPPTGPPARLIVR